MDPEVEIQSLKELVATLSSQVEELTQQPSYGGILGLIQSDAIAVSALIITVIFTLLRFRQQRIFALEKNLDVLQRLNELALANDENLKAALSSVKDIGEFDPVAARELFFHWHRINRMYRAWFLWKKWVIRKKDYENIVKNYATTLRLKAGPQLATLGQRGYENDFIIDLMAAIKNAKDPDAIDVSGSETLSPMPEAVKPSDDSGPHAS